MIRSSAETEALATSVANNGGAYFVPALTGLSAPYWDSFARGLLIGITPGTRRAHIVRAVLEGIVFSVKDFLETMKNDSGVEFKSIKVDGGAAQNDFLLQFQADMLDVEVVRPVNKEATSLGAAYMAGLSIGFWNSPEECFANQKIDKTFCPKMSDEERDRLYGCWQQAVQRAMKWIQVAQPKAEVVTA